MQSAAQQHSCSAARRRVIVLVDMDCFYVQVEKRLDPSLKGKPCAVVQYNKWQGGAIIAVDYEARKFGVKRNTRGNEARQKCPSIHLVQVPVQREKADLTRYRHAGAEVIKVLSRYTSCIERASIDEAFLDITASVFEKMESFGFKNLTPSDLPATHIAGHSTPTAVDKQAEQRGDSLIAGNSSMLQHGNTESDDEAHTFVSKTDADSVEWESGSLQPMQNQLDHPLTAIAKHQETVIEKDEVDNSMSAQRPAEDKEACRVRLLEEWLSGEGRGEEMTLAVGALMAREIREAVLKETGFTCSAGIAHNKMLAKLAAGMNKPNQQTVLPTSHVESVFSSTPLKKVLVFRYSSCSTLSMLVS